MATVVAMQVPPWMNTARKRRSVSRRNRVMATGPAGTEPCLGGAERTCRLGSQQSPLPLSHDDVALRTVLSSQRQRGSLYTQISGCVSPAMGKTYHQQIPPSTDFGKFYGNSWRETAEVA